MGSSARKTKWSISDELWKLMEPLFPKYKNPHPRGGGRKRINYRDVMNGIFFVMRTGCPWKALDAPKICSGSVAHARFQEWAEYGVFFKMWQNGLLDYDECHGIDWKWQSADGAMNKAPLAGKKNR